MPSLQAPRWSVCLRKSCTTVCADISAPGPPQKTPVYLTWSSASGFSVFVQVWRWWLCVLCVCVCVRLCVCWCVCVLPIYLGDSSPSYQGETCTSLCSLYRGLQFAVYFFCGSKPTGVTQEGVANTGAFFFLFSFFNAPPPPAVFASIFYREKGPAVPSLVDSRHD